MKNNLFFESLIQKEFLIMSHRGFWNGNIIENTIESCMLAFKAGADIVEVDICRTKDNKYYLFHDGGEPRVLSRNQSFQTLSSDEIANSSIKNSIGVTSGYKINTLKEFLEWLPQGKLVNIDRSWDYWDDEEFFKILNESEKREQLVLKSPVKKGYLESFSKQGQGFLYMPMVKKQKELELAQSYNEINIIGLEITVPNEDSELLDQQWLQEIHQNKLVLLANAEKLGEKYHPFCGADDDKALFNECYWEKYIEYGIGIIQTDWPNFLYAYREKRAL